MHLPQRPSYAGVCHRVLGGFVCACVRGSEGRLCERDVDECEGRCGVIKLYFYFIFNISK